MTSYPHDVHDDDDGRSAEALFAGRLNELWPQDPKTGKPYGIRRVAEMLADRGIAMKRSHLHNLQTGKYLPRLSDRARLAQFLGVPVGELCPDLPPEQAEQLALADSFRRHNVREVALRQLTDQFPEDAQAEVTRALRSVLSRFERVTQDEDSGQIP